MNIGNEYQENSLLLYKGAFTVNLISNLGNQIKSFPEIDHRIIQKLFRIFMELTQNVSYYSVEIFRFKNEIKCGSGWVTLQNYDKFFRITTGNNIKKEHGPKLTSYCEEINSFDEAELKKLKRDIRSTALGRDIEAQIGLIQTSIISGNKLGFKVLSDKTEHDFFIISATISKEVTGEPEED